MMVEQLSIEEKKQALDLVSGSRTFARSDRLRTLLQFICTAEIEGRQDRLNEYVIGVEALGRRDGYSPGEDSCVRSRVYELRQRLERFYTVEAPEAPVRIDLPKGCYVPRYVRATPEQHPQPVSAFEHAPVAFFAQPPAPKRDWKFVAAFLLGVALTYCVFAFRDESAGSVPPNRAESGATWTADLESIWRPFLDPNTPVLVSFQSRLFVSAGPVVVRDTTVDSVTSIESSDPIMRTKALFAVPQLHENRNYTDFGSATACLLLGKLLGVRKPGIAAKRSSDVNWEDLQTNNVIYLGKPAADPDIARFLPKEHFVMDGGGTIRNLQPGAGELAEWKDIGSSWDRSNNWTEKYGLLTLIPSLPQGRWILSLAGAGSEHLWALAQFLTNPESAKQLVSKLRDPSGKIAPSWQVVVKADFKSQVPVKVEYVTHRDLDTGR